MVSYVCTIDELIEELQKYKKKYEGTDYIVSASIDFILNDSVITN